MAELSPILAELERLWPQLVAEYSELVPTEAPIIALSSKGRKLTQTGWYNPAKWVDSQEDVLGALAGLDATERVQLTRGEIVIATELLDDPVQTAAELLRQAIVHNRAAWTGVESVRYLAGAQGYYPIVWQNLAHRFRFNAFVLPDQPSRGWAGWKPQDPDAWATWVKEHMHVGVFEVARKSDVRVNKPGSRMKKWSCGCTVIRSATKVLMVCQKCGNTLKWAERHEVNPFWVPGDDDVPSFNLLDWAAELQQQLAVMEGY